MPCDSYNTIPAFKECAGKNCNNQPTTKLKIKFIKKSGLFCESCYLELKVLDLIEQEDIVDQRVGASLNKNMEDD